MVVTRRTFLQSTGVGALTTHLLGPGQTAEARQAPVQGQAVSKPNILFMLVDNLGYGELGSYGGGATRGHRRRASTSSQAKDSVSQT